MKFCLHVRQTYGEGTGDRGRCPDSVTYAPGRTVPDLDVEQELRLVQGVTRTPCRTALSYLKSNILVRY